MNYEKLICRDNSTIRDAMANINENTKGIAFIVNADDRLVGIATDGDIRRALLGGAGTNDDVVNYMNTDFLFSANLVDAQNIFSRNDNSVKIIPLVDKNMHVTGYAEYDNKEHVALAQPQLNGNEYNYLMDALLSTWISSTGKYLTRFEKEFSEYCGVSYGVAVSNGTTALHLALAALGIGKGDEVIVPDITFAATVNAVIYTGATPVIVDIEEDSWCIDPDKIEEAVTPATKAIIPVHVYGQPCDMGRICDIAKQHNLYIVEDCAEAHGAEYAGRKTGSFGDISCFSFFGNKVITTGEGGMCITDKKELNEKMRILRDHGMSRDRKYYHEVVGFNYRMTNMQAAIGVAQLEHIDDILKWHCELEEKYREAFSEIPMIQMQKNNFQDRKKITWLVSALVDENKRDTILQKFKENNIDARPFFIPLSDMSIYKEYAGKCSVSKKISKMGLNLPTTSDVNEEKIKRMIQVINTI